MAMYFHGTPPPEIPPDGLQTLYLMNPGYVGYSSDAAAAANMVLLNSAAANSMNSSNFYSISQPQQQQQQQQQQQHQQQRHFVGIPLQAQDSTRPPSVHYNLWNPTPASNPLDMTSQLGLRRPPQQGLSLSLSPQILSYRSEPPAPAISPASRDEVRLPAVSNSMPGLQSVMTGSKYLKVAQQLLDEVVNVGKGGEDESPAPGLAKAALTAHSRGNREKEEGDGGGEARWKREVAEISTAERQELHMKKSKLVSMLDEVEQRYRQYHHQMQVVIASFEAAAGFGSARTYTSLALKTISKQFRCLRDAISGQIGATSKLLGEEVDPKGGEGSGVGSRLRFVDHHLRQQRALQQLGMAQHNAWRPQRGLPERSVSVLRAWLFEHFLHPYPKDSDKQMLAKQTGLTRSQVSNWFINARVRLWKPMVEEMYVEETKEKQQNNNGDDKTSKITSDMNEDSVTSKSSTHQESSPTRTEQTDYPVSKQENPKFSPPVMIPTSASSGIIQMRTNSFSDNNDTIVEEHLLKKARSNIEPFQLNTMTGMGLKPEEESNRDFFARFGDVRRGVIVEDSGGYSLFAGAGGNGFGFYPIDPEQFAPARVSGNGGVSLTLGLQHCEGLSLSGAQPSYLSGENIPLGRRLEMSTETGDYCSLSNNPSVAAHPSSAFDSINIQSRKRFAAQLLPDFVA